MCNLATNVIFVAMAIYKCNVHRNLCIVIKGKRYCIPYIGIVPDYIEKKVREAGYKCEMLYLTPIHCCHYETPFRDLLQLWPIITEIEMYAESI